jgi:hypothetical protein
VAVAVVTVELLGVLVVAEVEQAPILAAVLVHQDKVMVEVQETTAALVQVAAVVLVKQVEPLFLQEVEMVVAESLHQ